MAIKQVCVFRSARSAQVIACVKGLKPKGRGVTIITHPCAEKEMRDIADHVILYDKPRFSRHFFTPYNIQMMKSHGFDEIVIVHNNHSGHGYTGLEVLALCLGAPKVRAFTYVGEWKRVTWWTVALKILTMAMLPAELLAQGILTLGARLYLGGKR